MLEAHHFTEPSQVMWSIHDDIRAQMKQAREGFAFSIVAKINYFFYSLKND